jgi:hypothetical protein
MTMKTKLLICLGALLCVAAVDAVKNKVEMPRAKLTVKVLDEQGAPMSAAMVTLNFMDPATRNAIPVEGLTNAEGTFSGEGQTDGVMSGGVNKEGFYRGGFSFKGWSGLENGRWEPWDATYTTNLRPIINPTEFYAKTGWFEIPAIGESCGYDLAKGDWVTPHGNGRDPDLIFTLQRRYESREDFEVSVKMSFSQPRDGIQEAQLPEIGRYSMFKWPRLAPEENYRSILETRFARDPKVGFTQSAAEEQAYFFRVRTVEQNGRIISALYGKIKGGLQLAPSNSKTCKVKLTYYLNPTSLDRNMEWDPKRNLLPGLSWEENPREP